MERQILPEVENQQEQIQMKYALILCSDMHMDIERANALLSGNKYLQWTKDYTEADVIIIMTCAFGSKKKHSMFVIAEAMKNSKPNARIIATGCLVKINLEELKVIPGLETVSFEEVENMLRQAKCEAQEQEACKIPQNTVVISNGCLKKCSYCVYPLIENKYTSKPMEQVLSEVEELYSNGEPVIYISGAHETSDYGIDLYGRRVFPELLYRICTQFPKCKYVVGWFHPNGLSEKVIDIIGKHGNIVQIMVHIQHIKNELLKPMHRPCFEETEAKIQKLHKVRPDLSISTEFIVGFPGETEEMFGELVDYLDKHQDVFTDIGVASYEPVLNTKAAQLANLPELSVRNRRMETIKAKFGAKGYEAPKDYEPLLLSYLEACYILSNVN